MRDAARLWLLRHAGLGVALALGAGALALLGRPARAGSPVALGLLLPALAVAAWLLRDAWRRLRLSRAGGAGVVEIAEGRVAFFGPETGGVADLDALQAVALSATTEGPVWVLTGAEGGALLIPLSAKGADSLIDAFAVLPGFDPGPAAAAAAAGRSRVVWRRGAGSEAMLATQADGPYMSRG